MEMHCSFSFTVIFLFFSLLNECSFLCTRRCFANEANIKIVRTITQAFLQSHSGWTTKENLILFLCVSDDVRNPFMFLFHLFFFIPVIFTVFFFFFFHMHAYYDHKTIFFAVAVLCVCLHS